jgi:uncharacterized paraquat-inducible protein A
MRFRNRLMSFMYGRNGIDKFGRFLFIFYIILVIAQWIISIFVPQIFSLILSSLIMLLAIYIFFRAFSRNLVKRQAENYKYIQFASKFKTFFLLQKSKFRDRKTHVYKKCPRCKAVLRLKKIKGKHRAVCPRCGNSFDVKV